MKKSKLLKSIERNCRGCPDCPYCLHDVRTAPAMEIKILNRELACRFGNDVCNL